MSKVVKGTMQIASWDEKPYSQVEGGSKLTLSVIEHKVAGDIEGEGKLDYLMVYFEDGSARFFGYEQIVGKYGSRQGSFVLRHEGSYEKGVAKVSLTVVAGTGTGGFKGMQGSGDFVAKDAQTSSFSLECSFD